MLTDTFDPLAVFRDPDSLVTDAAYCGAGFRDPQLLALVPWYSNTATRNGVACGNTDRITRRHSRYLDERASDEGVETAAGDAAHLEFSLQMLARRADAFDVGFTDTRRATCVDSVLRGFFAVFTQLPHFIAPRIEKLSERASWGRGGHAWCGIGQLNKSDEESDYWGGRRGR